MQERESNKSIVEELRSITEKSDMKQYLKSSWGGYTKDSVLEYLNLLRRQQQATAETFSRNQQILYEEKEQLKKSNDALKTRLNQTELEYRNLLESLRAHALEAEVEPENSSLSDVVALKNSISAMEEELSRSGKEKYELEQQIKRQNGMVNENAAKMEQSRQELLSVKEMLKAEILESKKQRSLVIQLSTDLEEKCREIRFINTNHSEGQISELTEKVNDLTVQLQVQTEVLSNSNHENDSKSHLIQTLNEENETLRQTVARLNKNIEEVSGQNDKLMFANKSISDQLETEYKRSIQLIKEKSFLTTEKLMTGKKLEEANTRVTMLETQLQKHANNEQVDSVHKEMYQSEVIKSNIS